MPKKITNSDLYVEIVKINSKLDDFREEVNEKFVTKAENHKVLNLVDAVLGELKAMRQEQAANSLRFDDTDREIQNIQKELKSWKTNN